MKKESFVTYGCLEAILSILSEEDPPYQVVRHLSGIAVYKYDYRLVELLGDFKQKVRPGELKRFDESYLYNYSPEEIESYICHLRRGERFCDGLLAGAIRSGRLEILCRRMMNFY